MTDFDLLAAVIARAVGTEHGCHQAAAAVREHLVAEGKDALGRMADLHHDEMVRRRDAEAELATVRATVYQVEAECKRKLTDHEDRWAKVRQLCDAYYDIGVPSQRLRAIVPEEPQP